MHSNYANQSGAAISFTAVLNLFVYFTGNRPTFAHIKFKDNAMVTFSRNHTTTINGDVIDCHSNCSITFQHNAIVTLSDNSAENSGAIFCDLNNLHMFCL